MIGFQILNPSSSAHSCSGFGKITLKIILASKLKNENTAFYKAHLVSLIPVRSHITACMLTLIIFARLFPLNTRLKPPFLLLECRFSRHLAIASSVEVQPVHSVHLLEVFQATLAVSFHSLRPFSVEAAVGDVQARLMACALGAATVDVLCVKADTHYRESSVLQSLMYLIARGCYC